MRLAWRLTFGRGSQLSGPWASRKLRVLSTWIPAVWSPLNGVTVAGQPAAWASAGELNHRPTWKVWTGLKLGFEDASGNGGALWTTGAAPEPGATKNVSMLKRPM